MKRKVKILLGIAAVVFLAIVYSTMTSTQTVAGQVHRDSIIEKSRFTPENSLDIAMAMKLVTHDPPHMLNPPVEGPPQLLYPPSEEELRRLSG